jgi:hypothetical protein
MDTKKEYKHPQAYCCGHLQGTVMNEASVLKFIAQNLEGDLYTTEERVDKIMRSVDRLNTANEEVTEILNLHYKKKCN